MSENVGFAGQIGPEHVGQVVEKGFIVIRPSDEPRPCILKWSQWKEDWIVRFDNFINNCIIKLTVKRYVHTYGK